MYASPDKVNRANSQSKLRTRPKTARDYVKSFRKVINAYEDCCLNSPLHAGNPDPDAPKPLNWRSAIEFKTDVENAAAKALNSDDLWNAFCNMVRSQAGYPCEAVSPEMESRVILACGRIFEARGLAKVQQYFVTIKKKPVA